jgi:hypothetical protein
MCRGHYIESWTAFGARRLRIFKAHTQILAEVVDPNGQSQGECEIPIDALRSPKAMIRRITIADETRWTRVLSGAKNALLPYPALAVQPGNDEGTKIEDVGFDFGGNP